jgi:NodT family efflux transporter outer membrane factor (OMF) lipoprotein
MSSAKHVVTTAAAACITLVACAVGPAYQRPAITVDDKWTAAKPSPDAEPHVDTAKPPPETWWRSFDDTTLDRLVDMAVQQNLPLQVAGLRIMQARAQLGVANAAIYPTVGVYGDAIGFGLSKNLPYVTSIPDVKRNFIAFEAGFDASWEIDLFGKYRSGVESSQSSLAASQADYDAALVSLAAEVARTYAAVRTNEVLIAQAQQNEKLQEEGLKLAQARAQTGATSELDVAQATALLASTQASVPGYETTLAAARHALATLLGLPSSGVEGLLIVPGTTAAVPLPPKSVPVGVPADMLRRRPDIQSAEHRAAAQAALIGVAKADLFPKLSLAGNVGLMTTTANNFDFNIGDALTYRVGPEITWQLFDFGATESRVRVEDAAYQQLLVQYQDAVLHAAQEVEDAMANFQNAERAVAFEEAAVAAAQRSVDIALIQYREGSADYERVLLSQRQLLEEQRALTLFRADATTGVIALYKSLGGGWESLDKQHPIPMRTQNEMEKRTYWGDVLAQPKSDLQPEASENKAGQP